MVYIPELMDVYLLIALPHEAKKPMGNELKELRVPVYFQNICPPHTQLVYSS